MPENKQYFDRDNLSPEVRNTSLWVSVNISLLTNSNLIRFVNLKTAICAYLNGEKVAEICSTHQITRQRLVTIIKRCLNDHPDGRLWGWRALIPYVRYSRDT